MAENKKGFILYADNVTVVKKLVEQDRKDGTNNAGELFLMILEYVNDMNPQPSNFITELSFEPIKSQLKRDLIKYEGTKIKRSEAGKKSAESKQQKSTKSTSVESVQQSSTKSTDIDNVNVIDNVIGKESVSVNQLTQWFKDLPNSTDLEDIARMTSSNVESLKPRVEEFKRICEVYYPTYQKFLFHFKRWLLKNPPTQAKQRKALIK